MNAAPIPISVIVPTYRDWRRLQLCLDALAAQTLPLDRFEVIVADNDPDGTRPPLRLAANVTVIGVARPGSYAARNAALRIARGTVLAFTDSDCLPAPGWLAAGLAALAQDGDARATGPIPIFQEAGGTRLAYLYQFHTAFRQRESAAHGLTTTANLMVARQTFDAVGPFDEALLSGGDFDWNRRAQALGVPLLFRDDMAVGHPARASIRAILKKRRRTTRAEAASQPTSVAQKARYLLRPPLGRITFDRGEPTPADRLRLFGIQYGMNLYALAQFCAVRWGLARPVRE